MQSGFQGHLLYSKWQAFSIMKKMGWNHNDMTRMQGKLFRELAQSGEKNFKNTRIAVRALEAGGATNAEARALVAESLWNLKMQGVIEPTHIPWSQERIVMKEKN